MTDSVLHFVIPSDYARMREVQAAIMDAVHAHQFDEESIFAIRLALEETIINAIKHGNKNDRAKTVTVDCTVTDTLFAVEVLDQGEGFKRKAVPDPLAEENLDKSSGRGLLLIESYMNSVKYSDAGRRVRMTRKNRR